MQFGQRKFDFECGQFRRIVLNPSCFEVASKAPKNHAGTQTGLAIHA